MPCGHVSANSGRKLCDGTVRPRPCTKGTLGRRRVAPNRLREPRPVQGGRSRGGAPAPDAHARARSVARLGGDDARRPDEHQGAACRGRDHRQRRRAGRAPDDRRFERRLRGPRAGGRRLGIARPGRRGPAHERGGDPCPAGIGGRGERDWCGWFERFDGRDEEWLGLRIGKHRGKRGRRARSGAGRRDRHRSTHRRGVGRMARA